ncbi:hypothetical protein [Novosphingobium mangrovi (ex Huang et al. 2023)]|uniref:START domain-containing protein n=1 Tax=Novosphingobium mangrovi (ex Huang et al. 2023) TaxID=2976432 RepID=A0ABT2I9G2_9SPHN|nr:hypothetical protein [Novosphingobium mangrovi (ex Huang et al. 2023)]MCT2401477.1 hypothetical protein [Novosphingobium mangrovi (ex Huang et al. 2023)]
MIALRAILAAGLALGGAGSAAAYDELPRGLARLTPAEVVQRIRVEDEALEPHIVVSTEKAWDRGRGIEGAHARDVHLRALVDRKSGAVRWQVWHELVVPDRRPDMVGVSYHAGGRLEQADILVAEHWLDDCPGTDEPVVSCNRYARFVFEVPDHVVEEIAGAYRPESRDPWRLRFKDENGGSITGGLAPAEAAGLIEVVDRVRGRDKG